MERMHPQDLRAQLALEFYKMCTDDIRQGAMEWAVESTDMLLAELERTAKAEPEGVWVLESEHKRVMEIMGRYEDASVEIPAVPELRSADHHSHRIWTFAKWLRDMLVKARADLEQQKNHPGWMDRIKKERQEERERIIALLDCEGDMPDGCPALLVRNVTSGSTLNAAQLRAVLEP